MKTKNSTEQTAKKKKKVKKKVSDADGTSIDDSKTNLKDNLINVDYTTNVTISNSIAISNSNINNDITNNNNNNNDKVNINQVLSNEKNSIINDNCKQTQLNKSGDNVKIIDLIKNDAKLKNLETSRTFENSSIIYNKVNNINNKMINNNNNKELTNKNILTNKSMKEVTKKVDEKRIKFRKYSANDFNLLRVLGRGSFGKVSESLNKLKVKVFEN